MRGQEAPEFIVSAILDIDQLLTIKVVKIKAIRSMNSKAEKQRSGLLTAIRFQ